MDLTKIMLLSVLFIIHWIALLYFSFYIFFRKNKTCDILYIISVFGVFLQWIILNECIISYIEKYIIDNTYVAGSEPAIHPSYGLFTYSDSVNLVITLIFFSFIMYNIYKLYSIYNFPYPKLFIIFIVLLVASHMCSSRIVKILRDDIKKEKGHE